MSSRTRSVCGSSEIIHLKSRLTEGTTSVDESVIVQEIQKCLGLESMTNIELKRIIKTINVNKNGMITIVLQ